MIQFTISFQNTFWILGYVNKFIKMGQKNHNNSCVAYSSNVFTFSVRGVSKPRGLGVFSPDTLDWQRRRTRTWHCLLSACNECAPQREQIHSFHTRIINLCSRRGTKTRDFSWYINRFSWAVLMLHTYFFTFSRCFHGLKS